MNFKEFLKKEAYSLNVLIEVVPHDNQSDQEFVSIKELGEWAWTNWKIKGKYSLKIDHTVYWEIAVACLGKKEIKKRLTELGEE